jgi:hypothetical protein
MVAWGGHAAQGAIQDSADSDYRRGHIGRNVSAMYGMTSGPGNGTHWHNQCRRERVPTDQFLGHGHGPCGEGSKFHISPRSDLPERLLQI